MKKKVLEALVINGMMQTDGKSRNGKIAETEKVVMNDDTSLNVTTNSFTTFSKRRRDTSHDNIIRPRDLPQYLGISRTSCWRLEQDPNSGFPSKIRLAKSAVGYFRHQLEAWLESRQMVGGSHEKVK